jgi:heme exporter protein D
VTREFDEWGGIGFFIWHTGYFTVCSWMVLLFMWVAGRRGEG